jgi:hypothetical protein
MQAQADEKAAAVEKKQVGLLMCISLRGMSSWVCITTQTDRRRGRARQTEGQGDSDGDRQEERTVRTENKPDMKHNENLQFAG